jgi:hypothetical protein
MKYRSAKRKRSKKSQFTVIVKIDQGKDEKNRPKGKLALQVPFRCADCRHPPKADVVADRERQSSESRVDAMRQMRRVDNDVAEFGREAVLLARRVQ